MMNIEVNGMNIHVKLCDNSSDQAVNELPRKGHLTFPMKGYANMEKFGGFGTQFPANDEHITTEAGDVILSAGNLLVIYYAPNTRNFTWFGKVQNLSESELKSARQWQYYSYIDSERL